MSAVYFGVAVLLQPGCLFKNALLEKVGGKRIEAHVQEVLVRIDDELLHSKSLRNPGVRAVKNDDVLTSKRRRKRRRRRLFLAKAYKLNYAILPESYKYTGKSKCRPKSAASPKEAG